MSGNIVLSPKKGFNQSSYDLEYNIYELGIILSNDSSLGAIGYIYIFI